MAADLAGSGPLRRVAAATAAAPAPRALAAVGSYEAYANAVFLEWTGPDGAARELRLRPEDLPALAAYRSLLAYGPLLASGDDTRPLVLAVSRFALCGEAPLLRELEIDPEQVAGAVRVRVEPLGRGTSGDRARTLEAPCPP